jgi:DNA replication protein DnaC
MIMERTDLLDMMTTLKLYGMRSAYDEILATALKRQHQPQRFAGDLLKAEISEKQARSIKYQLTISKLPLAKDADDFAFADTPINEGLVRDLMGGGFIVQQRNIVLIGGTGTGKTHLALAIARNCIRAASRGRFFNTVDPRLRRGRVWSTGSRPRHGPGARDALPIISPVWTSSSLMNSAICPSLRRADSCCST